MEKPWTGSHGNLWKDEQEFWVPQVTKEGGGRGEAYAEAPSVVARNVMPLNLVPLEVTEPGQGLG